MGEAESPSRPSFPEVERGQHCAGQHPMATPWAVWLCEASRLRLSENLGSSHSSLLAVPVFPFLIYSLVDFFSFSSSTPLSLCLLPLAFVPFSLSLFYFSLFFSISLFIKKQISLSLPCFFPWFPYPTHLLFPLLLPAPVPPLTSWPPPSVSFAHAEITADKRAPPCTTVLHEALCNLVLGSLGFTSSLLGGVP